MVRGLDLFSKWAIAERGIADEVDAEVELLLVPEEAEEDGFGLIGAGVSGGDAVDPMPEPNAAPVGVDAYGCIAVLRGVELRGLEPLTS